MDRDAPDPAGRPAGLAGRPGRLAGARRPGRARRALALPDGTVADQLAFQLAVQQPHRRGVQRAARPAAGRRPGAAGRSSGRITDDRHLGTEVAGWVGRGVAVGHRGRGRAARCTGRHLSAVRRWSFMLLVALDPVAGRRAGDPARPDQPPVPADRPAPAGPPGLRGADRHPAGRGAAAAPPTPARRDAALAVADSAGRLVAPGRRRPRPTPCRPSAGPGWRSTRVARGLDGAAARSRSASTGEQVIRAVQAHPGAQYLVTSGEDVVGVLHVADLAAAARTRPERRRRDPTATIVTASAPPPSTTAARAPRPVPARRPGAAHRPQGPDAHDRAGAGQGVPHPPRRARPTTT